MTLSAGEIARFEEDGLLLLGQLLDDDEVALLRREARRLGSADRRLAEANLRDAGSGVVWRSYSVDRDSEPFRLLTRLPRLLDRARAVLGADLYLWQAHMNHKVARHGEAWHWHRDYANWRLDGLPRGGVHDVLTFMVMLDDSTPENGPLQIVRGSHKVEQNHGAWDADSGKFALQAVTPDEIAHLLAHNETVEVTGPAGSVVMFTGLAAHGSQENRSALPRCNAYLAYARSDNRRSAATSQRPQVSRYQLNVEPADLDRSVDDGALRRCAAGLDGQSGGMAAAG